MNRLQATTSGWADDGRGVAPPGVLFVLEDERMETGSMEDAATRDAQARRTTRGRA